MNDGCRYTLGLPPPQPQEEGEGGASSRRRWRVCGGVDGLGMLDDQAVRATLLPPETKDDDEEEEQVGPSLGLADGGDGAPVMLDELARPH